MSSNIPCFVSYSRWTRRSSRPTQADFPACVITTAIPTAKTMQEDGILLQPGPPPERLRGYLMGIYGAVGVGVSVGVGVGGSVGVGECVRGGVWVEVGLGVVVGVV